MATNHEVGGSNPSERTIFKFKMTLFRVIFSKDQRSKNEEGKFLAMEDIRWKQRFENYNKAFSRLQEALAAVAKEPGNHLYEMATIQAFEFTIELGWKLLKDYLKHEGLQEISLPRDVIRHAFQAQLIADGQTWIDMLEARNKTPHTYDDAKAAAMVLQIQSAFIPALQQAQNYFLGKLQPCALACQL
jgi:nucleotidyltransferase substrate binding protein (TIGR01987 family)